MALSEDLINFDLIESHKENIQSLPSGRSAKALVSSLSPNPSGKAATFGETKTLNDAIRQEYENELKSIAEADDPLAIYSNYVNWTLNAYPSAQSTPQSQLLPLLERATKTFLTSPDYKNDPRYLKLWLHYIRLFSDAPRETFAFLARHNIGEHLALFYEEFASWLEGAGRWNQADEVYRLGIEREARPTERLMRKQSEFQHRYEAQPKDDNGPASPALPKVRAALAAKIDPFASASREDAQEVPRQSAGSVNIAKPKKQKMTIFSDADNDTPPPVVNSTNGWDSIGTMKERRKENTIEARPWTGETLKSGKKVGNVQKMEIFRDPNESKKTHNSKRTNDVFNPRTGRAERVYINMDAVYPQDGDEFSFEELRAMYRGWSTKTWIKPSTSPMRPTSANSTSRGDKYRSKEPEDIENLSNSLQESANIQNSSPQDNESTSEIKPPKQKKIKMREVKQETQTVKTRLESPTGRKVRRKGSSEPTMTFHSKAAHNDIYDMFNTARKAEDKDDTQSGDDTDFGDGDDTYSTTGESIGTGRISANNSEYGDETTTSVRSFGGGEDTSVSPWSDFTASKHLAKIMKQARSKVKYQRSDSEDLTENMSSSQNPTQKGFDTQAIAAIANQDFGDLDTVAIARLAGDEPDENLSQVLSSETDPGALKTPVEAEHPEQIEIPEKPRYIPLPPEDYEPTPLRPYRDPEVVAQNKLPFMTPIVERTESSLAPSTIYCDKDYLVSKTPSRSAPLLEGEYDSPSKIQIDSLLVESPQAEAMKNGTEDEYGMQAKNSSLTKLTAESSIKENQKIAFPVSKVATIGANGNPKGGEDIFKTPEVPAKPTQETARTIHKGPIILDLQCNPCDPLIRDQILQTVHPPVSSYHGYHENLNEQFNNFSQVKSFADKVAKQKGVLKGSPKRGQSEKNSITLRFEGSSRVYAVRRQLGEGAFAPVYLADSLTSMEDENTDTGPSTHRSDQRSSLEAIKAESPPETLRWEFHILYLLRSRLGSSSRAMQSILYAHECHLYRDECYLVLDYHSQGTLLDLVNHVRNENVRSGKAAEGLEEPIAMWLGMELLRVIEDVHRAGVLHGDLKADNCLVRFDPSCEITGPFNRCGNDGWSSRGLTLIDFGRGIDIRSFKPEARFVADWKAEETDCAEIREARPWKWQIDFFGAAGVIHSLLFGKYIETVAVSSGGLGQKKEWKLRETFKRYWDKEIWSDVFAVLLNGGGANEGDARKEISRIRILMEDWLEHEGERNGRDLRSSLRRCERLVGATVNVKGRR